jgi:hypothetical protein
MRQLQPVNDTTTGLTPPRRQTFSLEYRWMAPALVTLERHALMVFRPRTDDTPLHDLPDPASSQRFDLCTASNRRLC